MNGLHASKPRALNWGLLALTGLLIASMTACGASRETALVQDEKELMKATAEGDFAETVAEGDELWEQRGDRAKLEAAIDAWNKATRMDTPGKSETERREALYDVYVKLAHAYYFLSDAHIRLSDGMEKGEIEESMKTTYEEGVTAAEKALTISSPKFAKAIKYEKPFAEAVNVLDKSAVPAMYWYATNLGKWALLEGFATILARKDDAKAMMDRIIKMQPTYFYGAPYRYFGVYYTKLPFPGGDPEKSEEFFMKAITVAPNYLATRVLMADNYATKIGDKELYREQLEFVINFDLSKAPELKPENEAEQAKAKMLLDQINDKF